MRTFIIISIAVMAFQLWGQDISTRGEVYDFEVGDIFHFDENGPNYTIINWEVIEKYYSADMDTVFYVRNYSSKMISPQNPEWTYVFLVDTLFYSGLDEPVNSGLIDSVYSDPMYYNGRKINFYHDQVSGSMYWEYSFVNGCGVAIAHNEGGPPLSYILQLVYYKKGNEEWGTPLIVGFDEDNYTTIHFYVYPNPATSFITITTPQGQPIEEVIIYNHLGQKVLFAKPVNNTLDVSGLKAGIYVVEVITNEGRYRTKLIKNN